MSSCGNPAVETDALMARKRKHDRSAACVKCKQPKGNIIIRHSVYCKNCFISTVTGKFRRNLDPCINSIAHGPRKLSLKASGNLLVGFSGGLGSTVLLDLVASSYFQTEDDHVLIGGKPRGGKDHPRNVQAWKQGTVAYVEVCAAFPGTRDRTDDVRAMVKENYPCFKFIALRIEDAFDADWWTSVGGHRSSVDEIGVDMNNEALILSATSASTQSPVNRLNTHLAALPTHTALPSTVQTLIRLLLLHTAHANSCSHLLMGTSATRLAIGLVAGIAGGSGFVVGGEVEEEWTPPQQCSPDVSPPKNVRVNRPLRDAGTKECTAWAWWRNLRVLCGKNENKTDSTSTDIGVLTHDFITHLDRDYPSTVSTIARTCGKLAPAGNTSGHVHTQTCVLCGRPAQPGVQAWKERIAIRSFEINDPPSASRSHAPSLTPRLCYACHTTLTSRSSRGAVIQNPGASANPAVSLPVWVSSQLQEDVWISRKNGESALKGMIGEYLLDP